MAKMMTAISQALQEFIEAQQLFFVGTADADGRVNVSPKGLDGLRVLGPNRVIWLNLTGSGNETAAHLLGVNRMTLMFCSFGEKPLILRLYGKARAVHEGDPDWESLVAQFSVTEGARQVFDLEVEQVQTSCGFGVPQYDYQGERDLLLNWSDRKGDQGIRDYWKEKNQTSIDGKPTGIPVTE